MINQASNSSIGSRYRKTLVRAACGLVLSGVAWTSLSSVAEASPSQVRSPGFVQEVVGLRQGAVGEDVRAVQRALIAAGVSVPGGADGNFGPATRTALLSFQRSEGLEQSGEVDAGTAAALGLTTSAAGSGSTATAVNGLKQGASGDAVKELQQKLAAAGVFVPGGADGQFGSATAKAVSDYQSWNGLAVSGVVDAATAQKLGLGTAAAAQAQPPPTSSSNPYVGLAVGSRGSTVKELQTALMATGISVAGGADGVFGNVTKSALASYQRSNGLSASGSVDAATAQKLGLGTAAAAQAQPPPTSSSNPYVGLAVGSRGSTVKELQTALMATGISVAGGADGVFGNVTKSALASYQRSNGLSASGSVDAATAQKLGLGTAAAAQAQPPPTSSSNPYVGLAVGSRGSTVKELQTALMATGISVAGGADGVFGNVTKSALQGFQRVNGIAQTGVVTEEGARILNLGSTASAPSGGGATAEGYPKKGESSERVRLLQQAMINQGINVFGGADGSFGNATAAAVAKFQQAKGLAVTGTVTQQTADRLDLAPSTASAPPSSAGIVMKRFPVQGRCYYGNTWHAPRGGGRLHEGVDVIAAEGNLLYAVVDGTISKQYWDQPGALAGNGLRVAQDNGTYFTYLHLSGFAPGIKVGTKVKAGDVIGFVGNTGSSSTPHLHFEVHPGGGAAVNPYPYIKAIDGCSNTTAQYSSSFGPT